MSNPAVCLSPNGVDDYRFDTAPKRLLVGSMDGVIELLEAQSQWSASRRFLIGRHVSALLAVGETIIAGTHGDGLHASFDGGRTWSLRSAGFDSRNIFTLAVVRAGGSDTLYAGTEPAYLYRSVDGGRSWEELPALRSFPTRERWNFPAPPHVAHVKHVTADPRNPSILYVSIEQGALLKSWDGGASFQELHFQGEGYALNKDAHRIVFSPGDPDEIYLDGGDGIARSKDAGLTWERIATPRMRVGYPDQLFISPDSEDTLFVVGGGTPPNIWRQTGDAQSTIVRSRDRGRSWQQLDGGLPPHLRGNLEAASLVRWHGGFGLFAGSTDGEVFYSGDRGETWRMIAAGLPPVSKCIHHRNLTMGRAASGVGATANPPAG